MLTESHTNVQLDIKYNKYTLPENSIELASILTHVIYSDVTIKRGNLIW